jgi:hypothetical protein
MNFTRIQLAWLAAGIAALLALGAVAVFVASGDDDETLQTEGTSTSEASSSTTDTFPSTTSTPSTTGPAGEVLVRTYFARDEGVATAGRDVVPPAVARGALEALLEGPNDLERSVGMATEIPAGTDLLDVAVAGGEATVDLSSELESGGGSLSMQLRVAQVVFTLTQFESVDEVTILVDGEEVDGIGGEGVPANDLTRADFEDVTPLILVESPVPGEESSTPLEVSGISNTFEATVIYDLTDAGGQVVDDGFTTATAGTGTWGTFDFSIPLAGAQPGLGTLTLYQEDASDGSRRDGYEVPVRLAP